VTNLDGVTPEFVIGAYHRLFQIEKSFRMAKSDLAARPIYHRTRDSIEARLTIVFAALAVSRWIEDTTGRSMKKFVKTTRRYREIEIQAGEHVLTAAAPYRPTSAPPSKPSNSEPEGTNLSQLGTTNGRTGPGSTPATLVQHPAAHGDRILATQRIRREPLRSPAESAAAANT
jgi:hypothetical protein